MARQDVTTMTTAELTAQLRDTTATNTERTAARLERLRRGPQTHTVTLRGIEAERVLLGTFGVSIDHTRRAA